MARKVLVQLVDDLDETELGEGGQTVTFSLDGSDYEIDLGKKNADAFRKAMEKYVHAARRVARGGKTSSGRRVQHGATLVDAGTGVNPKEVRAWAVDKGLMSADSRGRIPGEIVDKYKEEHAA